MKQRIFIGSSREGLNVAERIKDFFKDSYDCFLWTDDIFQYNEGFLETLVKSASLFDFGFMVFSADDMSKIRGKEHETVRDNVLFEYGLFLGRVGIDNAYVLCEKGVKIPSDLLGITLAEYTTKCVDGRKEPDASLKSTLGKLKKRIDERASLCHLGLLPSTVIAISYFENFVKLVTDYIFTNEGNIEIDGKKYDSARIRIVIPRDLDADMKRHATHYFRTAQFTSSTVPTVHRSYPIYIASTEESENVITFADMPTILNGIDKAIDLYFRVGYIGKTADQQLTEEREMANFVRVLSILIDQDSYCKKIVEIVDEDNHPIV
ncbi:STING domain-containing protein [Bacteroides pyogenes]|uniref:CBASS system CD-NTase-associated NAD(+) hydrolase Cap12 n=1 Tax=Bacteroides pyogenes TaxID=310300 RepID=UPI002FDA465D